ncbi:hybrid-cluster NAD(P)-dependent oxidoreductase (plasmid) [Rhizobium sp. CB3171]|uniref:hybrid-cluster NAD(P)-dependent oxidoreductase n=1 Tax=Rhizobium sp. CB3171 TaxID=3039157 RepID=UPI0024B0AF8A|nr:hybrid-cluster NAD(P)-dependent oxidoreductase [Rhizobium sp. CB3171]WFU05106.1 hybrid-cluster NAD(P)-dependent oxidoreductase [Rhizobium sp. CB3171]
MLTKSPFRYDVFTANKQPRYQGGPANLICKAVITETHDAKTFVFEDALNRAFDFKPGQYALCRFEIEGKAHYRAYSVSSAPTRPHNVSITVKRVPGGLVSNWLNDHARPGMRLDIMDIAGDFNIIDRPFERPLFLSGGSGITPVMSMLQFLNDTADPVDIAFVHFARTPHDVIFRDHLDFVARRFKNVSMHLVVGDDLNDDSFSGSTGEISAALLRSLVPDLRGREVFMCGPEGFMRAARSIFSELDVVAINQESFGERIAIPENDKQGGQVNFTLTGATLDCAAGETLLETAMNAGVWINSSCRQGVCGSCRVRVTEGKVRMDDLGGITEQEKAEGYALACCSRPIGAVSIEA